jgi:ribose transport system substrate-binding protein
MSKRFERRLISRSLVVLMAAAFAVVAISACGSSSSSSESSTTASSEQSSTGGGESGGSGGESAGATGTASWCGPKEITLGVQDGGGLNAWSAESKEQVLLEAKNCPQITKVIEVDADFESQKAVSGMQSMIAQGANAIVVIPDSGVCAELPTMRQATQRGIAVVPWAASGCGTNGTDYVTDVDWNPEAAGETWANWLFKQMGGKGKVLYIGGPPGNPVDEGQITGMDKVVEEFPEIEILDGVTPKNWPVGDWDPATSKQIAGTLLAKYPEINGILMGDGQSTAAVISVFQADNRPIPPVATLEANQLGCLWHELKGTPEEFQMATISGRNWLGRYALRKAVAAANELPEQGKSIVDLPLFENSVGGREPVCEESDPPGRYNSNFIMTEKEMNELMGEQ